jgi:hypothetical protein
MDDSRSLSKKEASEIIRSKHYYPIFSKNKYDGNLLFTVVPYKRPPEFDILHPIYTTLTARDCLAEETKLAVFLEAKRAFSLPKSGFRFTTGSQFNREKLEITIPYDLIATRHFITYSKQDSIFRKLSITTNDAEFYRKQDKVKSLSIRYFSETPPPPRLSITRFAKKDKTDFGIGVERDFSKFLFQNYGAICLGEDHTEAATMNFLNCIWGLLQTFEVTLFVEGLSSMLQDDINDYLNSDYEMPTSLRSQCIDFEHGWIERPFGEDGYQNSIRGPRKLLRILENAKARKLKVIGIDTPIALSTIPDDMENRVSLMNFEALKIISRELSENPRPFLIITGLAHAASDDTTIGLGRMLQIPTIYVRDTSYEPHHPRNCTASLKLRTTITQIDPTEAVIPYGSSTSYKDVNFLVSLINQVSCPSYFLKG